jgi:hypothetical protein
MRAALLLLLACSDKPADTGVPEVGDLTTAGPGCTPFETRSWDIRIGLAEESCEAEAPAEPWLLISIWDSIEPSSGSSYAFTLPEALGTALLYGEGGELATEEADEVVLDLEAWGEAGVAGRYELLFPSTVARGRFTGSYCPDGHDEGVEDCI